MNKTSLPPEWATTTLKEVTLPRGLRIKPSAMQDAPFIGLEHIEAHTMRLLATAKARDVKSSASYFGQGDVIYGRLRPYLNKVYMPDFSGLASGEFIVFPSHSNLDNGYLKYFLNQWEFVSFVTRLNTGDRPRVDFSQFADYPFPLPPLPEQRRIVAEIEKQLTRLDSSVTALKRVQANLKRYRASVLKAACEGKLVPTEAELARSEGRDYEPADQLLARILSERRVQWEAQEKRRGKYKEPVAPDNTGLPALPEGWSYVQIEQILSLNRSGLKTGPFGSLLKKHEHKKNGVPVLGIENIQRMEFVRGSKIFVTPQKAQELSSYDVQEGDILISRSGTVGEACVLPAGIGDARLSTNLMRMTLAKEFVSPQYFCLLFNGSPTVLDQVSELCSGSTRDFLNGKILRSMVFPLPPSAEQHRIVAEVERRLSVIQQAEVAVEANLSRAERLRQSILKQAFSGKLVPQDRNDEPASALLERIRVEREASHATAKSSRQTRPRRGKSLSARQLVPREGNP